MCPNVLGQLTASNGGWSCEAYPLLQNRIHAGAEIDLLIERAKPPWMVMEVKPATAPAICNRFDIAYADPKLAQRYLAYRGAALFPMRYAAQALGWWH